MVDMKGRTFNSLFYDFVKNVEHKNKSFSYVLPMLGGTFLEYQDLKGCYIFHDDYPELKDNIFLWVEKKSENLIERLTKHPEFIHFDNIDDENNLLYFNVPVKYLEDFKMFKDSKYSKLSNDYKKDIVTFWDSRNIPNIIDVLYRKETAYLRLEKQYDIEIPRDIEASSALISENETFKQNYLKKCVE
jgi:hypothetical protein